MLSERVEDKAEQQGVAQKGAVGGRVWKESRETDKQEYNRSERTGGRESVESFEGTLG